MSPLWVVWYFSAAAWFWHVPLTPGWGSLWVTDTEAECREVLRERFEPLLRPGDRLECRSAFDQPPGRVAQPSGG